MPTRKTSTKSTTNKTAKSKAATSKKKASPKKKVAKKTTAAKKSPAKSKKTDDEVTIDRRRNERRDGEVAQSNDSKTPEAKPKLERRAKVSRRRQIDPTTCERDYSDQEVEFMSALDDYKRKSGRMFPTCSEVLEVIRNLGYVQLSPADLAAHNAQSDDLDSVSATSEWSPTDDEQVEADAELV